MDVQQSITYLKIVISQQQTPNKLFVTHIKTLQYLGCMEFCFKNIKVYFKFQPKTS